MAYHRQAMGNDGAMVALLASFAMFALAFFAGPAPRLTGDMGICLKSPNEWGMTPLMGWVANLSVFVVTLVTLWLVNRQYTLVQGSDTVLTGMFAIMVSSNVWLSGGLSSSCLLALANLVCLVVLLGCYRKRNATQELCIIATILSLGSMIQYAFIFMIPVYLIGAGFMKCLRFKGIVAFILGLAAPYWVGIGLGIIPLSDFTMPMMSNLFDGYVTKPILLAGIIIVGITILLTIILTLGNMVRLYAGNTQRRLSNLVVNVLGGVCALCIIFDAANMVAYLATLYMVAALQLANLFALRNVYQGNRWVFVICLAYVAGFAVMMTV